ncbi:MAG TPA: HAD family hydrolase [Candidatus Desulfovibrio intestinavium]|uniref:phosphoglycolate phosphatase n=1 Tax=Candidatus Desulfovibrio intestinavium TaxID=2838534 RepID=A0A9D2HRA4_9BACT|nr:HAD family hydrolase [Candidatus Desulfovibrio intestinavium]
MRREIAGKLFPQGIGGVIFDCDGVIIDSRTTNGIYYNRILEHFGLPPMTPEQERYSFMATARQALEYILPPELHAQIDYVTSEVVVYRRDILPLLRLCDGFRDVVEWLHAHGVRMAIDTNRTGVGMQTVLDIFGLPPYFNPVVAADTPGIAPKPSPQGAEFILAAWGLPPQRVLFVGDSSHDGNAAAGAGIPFAAFGNEELPGDIVALNYAALRAAIAESVEQQTCS